MKKTAGPRPLFLLLCFVCTGLFAQQSVEEKIDSMKRQLAVAKHDTDRMMLTYWIGVETRVARTSFWDSIFNIAHQYHNHLYETKALRQKSNVHFMSGSQQEGFSTCTTSLSMAEKFGFRREEMLNLWNLQSFYSVKMERKKALSVLYKGLEIAEELKDSAYIASFYNGISIYCFSTQDYASSLKWGLRCLKLSRQIKDEFYIASGALAVGTACFWLGNKKAAAYYYMLSKKYVGKFPGATLQAQVYISVAQAFRMYGQKDSSERYAKLAYKSAEAMNDQFSMAGTLMLLSGMAYDAGDYDLAEAYALRCLEISKKTGFNLQLPDLTGSLKRIYIKKGDYKKALEFYELHIAVRDSFANEKMRKQALEKEFEHSMYKQENENRLLSQQNQIQALQLSRNSYLVFALGSMLVSLAVIAFLFNRQNGLKAQHQQMLLEQKLLRSQMNPHFIFNSMNSIRQFIMSGQNDKAERYLTRFSKLIRELLETSTRENHSLSEEIAILKGYLQIESLRFSSSFGYTIHTDDSIDADKAHIPNLMIQPFVENAIWHGLLNKNGDRLVQISFTPDSPGTIRCVVDDNGVGRAESAKKEKPFRKKSLAVELANRRIELLKKTKSAGSIQIIDKVGDDGEALGTTVVIILPVLNA